MKNNGACAYGKVTRQIVEDIKDNIEEMKSDIKDTRMESKEMFNHLSNRLPMWAVVMGWLLFAICGGLISIILNNILGG